MVHALSEAQRVLKPGGLLLDLRPGPVHRRVGIQVDGRYQQVAIMGETLAFDHAANRAVREVLNRGLFKQTSRLQFDCRRVMALKDFRPWLQDFGGDSPAWDERLLQTVEAAYRSTPGKKQLIVSGPLILRVLQK